jgi:hypothetical protein
MCSMTDSCSSLAEGNSVCPGDSASYWSSLADGVSTLYGERGKGSTFTGGLTIEMLISDHCVSSSFLFTRAQLLLGAVHITLNSRLVDKFSVQHVFDLFVAFLGN